MKSFWLTLGWGAARGLFHIGVLKYIEEKNIKITEISGTSMGALIGTARSLGFTAEQIHQMFQKLKYRKLVDVGFSSGVFKGKRIKKELQAVFGTKTFNDTQIPLKIIAADIKAGKKIVFDEGKLTDAVRASISIPGIFDPYCYKGHCLVDGGLVENLPVSELQSQDVIAVSAIKKISNLPKLDIQKHIKKREVARRSWFILLESNEALSLELSKKNITLIEFSNPKISYADFRKLDQMVEEGYQTACKTLS